MNEPSLESQTTTPQRRTGRIAALVVGLLAASVVAIALFEFTGGTGASPTEPAVPAQGVTSQDELTGAAFANEIGLIRHDYDSSMKIGHAEGVLTLDGSPMEGCETPTNGDQWAMITTTDGGLYCFSAPTDFEVWVIGQRLSGHVPTDEEVALKQAELEGAPK